MLKSIQQVIGAVSPRMPMPALSNFQLKLDGQKLTITATDLEVTISSTVELIEASGSGGVLIQAKRFHDLIRELPETPLEIEVLEPFKVKLRGEGVGQYDLPGEDPIDFPELPTVEGSSSFVMDTEVFRRIVGKTIFAVSKDEMRPVLTGILFQLRSGELRVVATDGHRLSRVLRQDVNYNGETRDEIIPMKALNLLSRNLADRDQITVALAETRASFTATGQRLITRLIDGHYPKYENVIPKDNPNKMRIRLSEFTSGLRRVQIFASQITRQVKLTMAPTTGSLEAEDPEYGGRGREEVSMDYEGEPLEIAYNATYLMDAIRQIDTEEAYFELASSNDAAIIRPTTQQENEDFLMLLMPIRLR